MIDMLNLNPGKYWFFGFGRSADEVEEKMFNSFLRSLPLNNVVYNFRTGSIKSEAIGLYYFEVVPDKPSYRLEWVSKYARDQKDLYEKIITDPTYVQLSHLNGENHDHNASTLIYYENEETPCNETCVFYWFCDRNRTSQFNPSVSMGLPCSVYKHSKNSYRKLQF